jgi:S1-C subfamily serine protease
MFRALMLCICALISFNSYSRNCDGDERTPVSSVVSIHTSLLGNPGGAAVAMSPRYIITTAHQVFLGNRVAVYFCAGGNLYGTVVYRDTELDLAVILSDEVLPVPPISVSSRRIMVDEWVRAIGHPDRSGWEVSQHGLVLEPNAFLVTLIQKQSGSDEMVATDGWAIRTSALVWTGSSGGALVNRYGELVGVVTNREGIHVVPGVSHRVPGYARAILDLCVPKVRHDVCAYIVK